jgi:hypothetical protein
MATQPVQSIPTATEIPEIIRLISKEAEDYL